MLRELKVKILLKSQKRLAYGLRKRRYFGVLKRYKKWQKIKYETLNLLDNKPEPTSHDGSGFTYYHAVH